MKKTCNKCGEPFNVIEDGDDPAELDKDVVYLPATAETCLDCHADPGLAPWLLKSRAAAPGELGGDENQGD